MTLTKRIIPCLDVANGRVVKGLNFESIKDAGDPVQLAEKYSSEGADELIFLDITASSEQRETIKSLVKKIAEVIDIPFTVGGGVKSLQHARDILLNGADKVSINTGAVKNPGVITELMELFGRQCIVIAIDAKRNYNIEKGKNIFLSYCDIHWTGRGVAMKKLKSNYIYCFKGWHPFTADNNNYAFCKVDRNKIISVKEKKSFTKKWQEEPLSIGLFFFKSGK